MLTTEIAAIRKDTIEKILAKQDDSFRWGFAEKQARAHPEYVYYSPNFRSTLWTLILLADLKAPNTLPQITPALQLITDHFYDPARGLFRLPGDSHFPIPCLNGNLLYLHHYFQMAHSEAIDKTIQFFATYQRFDDGAFKTPKTYPYCSNTSCYGKHTCYWGVIKLLKGISFIPKIQRTAAEQRLIENCIDFVLQHSVCFGCHHKDKLLHRDIGLLTFPNFYKSDFLEILWLLAREEVHDQRLEPALALLRARMKAGHCWALEKPQNTIVPIGQKDCANAFITERATAVLAYHGN